MHSSSAVSLPVIMLASGSGVFALKYAAAMNQSNLEFAVVAVDGLVVSIRFL